MKEKPYHHGNLQTELIEEGLALIHEEGKGNFSLRKLAGWGSLPLPAITTMLMSMT